MHGPSKGKITLSNDTKIKLENLKELSKKHCKCCDIIFTPKDRRNKFCSKSCSATYNNKGNKQSSETKEKISKKLANLNQFKKIKWGEYTKIKIVKCNCCKKRTVTKLEDDFICCYSNRIPNSIRIKYKFKFDVEKYPDIFDLETINNIGWYCANKKSEKYNLNGLSKDHKVSVKYAFENSCDPFYITHPLNCEIMKQSKNARKNRKNSISYNELIKSIDEYENSKNWLLSQDSNLPHTPAWPSD